MATRAAVLPFPAKRAERKAGLLSMVKKDQTDRLRNGGLINWTKILKLKKYL